MHSSNDQVRWKWDATQTRWTILLKMQTFISQGRTPAPATDTFCHNQGYSCTHVHVECTRVHIAITALQANDSRVYTSSNVWACDHQEMMCGLAN